MNPLAPVVEAQRRKIAALKSELVAEKLRHPMPRTSGVGEAEYTQENARRILEALGVDPDHEQHVRDLEVSCRSPRN
jgi:hypothetical protein